MKEITVPAEDRPTIWTYVAFTALGWLVVGVLVAGTVGNARDPLIVGLFAGVGGLVNLVVLFGMVESLVKAWFDAAVVTEE